MLMISVGVGSGKPFSSRYRRVGTGVLRAGTGVDCTCRDGVAALSRDPSVEERKVSGADVAGAEKGVVSRLLLATG